MALHYCIMCDTIFFDCMAEREQLQDLVPAPMSSVKVTGNIAKPTAVKILPKGKATKDSYRTGATGNLSRNHTQDAMATLAK